MAGINISFVSDVRSMLKGTGDIEDALDKVGDSLDDVAKDAKTSGDKVEKSLTGISDEADDSSKKLERKFRDSFDEVHKDAKDKTDKIAKDTKHNMDKAGDATGEFKDEGKQNFAEVSSSFTGDMQGAIDGIQGTLGGLANSAIPGVGIAAGLAAAGIGTVYTVLSTQAEATKQNITDLTQAMIDANSKVIAESFIQQNLIDIVSGADGAAISMKNLKDAAEETGVPIETLARAYAGDPGSVATALATVRTGLAQAEVDVVSLDAQVAANSGVEEYRRWAGALEGLQGNYDSAAAGLDLFQDAAAVGAQENQREIGETRKAYEDAHRAVGDLSTAIQNIPAPAIIPTVDLRDVKRQIREVTDGVYQIRINGVRAGMPYS